MLALVLGTHDLVIGVFQQMVNILAAHIGGVAQHHLGFGMGLKGPAHQGEILQCRLGQFSRGD